MPNVSFVGKNFPFSKNVVFFVNFCLKNCEKGAKNERKIDLTPPTAIPRNLQNMLYGSEGVSYQSLTSFKTLVWISLLKKFLSQKKVWKSAKNGHFSTSLTPLLKSCFYNEIVPDCIHCNVNVCRTYLFIHVCMLSVNDCIFLCASNVFKRSQ